MECKFVSRTKYRNKYSIFNIFYIYPYILYALYALLHLQIAHKYPQSGRKKKKKWLSDLYIFHFQE